MLLVHVLLVIMGKLKVAHVAWEFNKADMKMISCDNDGFTGEHKTARCKILQFSRFYFCLTYGDGVSLFNIYSISNVRK